MKTKITSLIILIFTALLLSSCNSKKPAIGVEDQIIVIADSLEYEQLESTLLQVFSKIIYTPQPERIFNIQRKNISYLKKYKKFKNVIFAAPLNSGSNVSKYLGSILDSNVTEMFNDDSISVVNKYDLWAKNQLVMFLSGSSIEKMKEKILNNHSNLLHYFQQISNKRLSAKLYNDVYEKKKTEAQFLKDYGWIIYVQIDFKLAVNDSENNFVWLRRAPGTDIERWIFVHWIDNASPAYLNADSVSVIRNRITAEKYRTSSNSGYVEIADDYKTTSEVNFNNRYALMTQGLWRMTDQTMGGPFVNYTFYDKNTKRLYMIDGAVYAPKYEKKSLIQQVDVILQSFLTKDELSESRIENLMDELED